MSIKIYFILNILIITTFSQNCNLLTTCNGCTINSCGNYLLNNKVWCPFTNECISNKTQCEYISDTYNLIRTETFILGYSGTVIPSQCRQNITNPKHCGVQSLKIFQEQSSITDSLIGIIPIQPSVIINNYTGTLGIYDNINIENRTVFQTYVYFWGKNETVVPIPLAADFSLLKKSISIINGSYVLQYNGITLLGEGVRNIGYLLISYPQANPSLFECYGVKSNYNITINPLWQKYLNNPINWILLCLFIVGFLTQILFTFLCNFRKDKVELGSNLESKKRLDEILLQIQNKSNEKELNNEHDKTQNDENDKTQNDEKKNQNDDIIIIENDSIQKNEIEMKVIENDSIQNNEILIKESLSIENENIEKESLMEKEEIKQKINEENILVGCTPRYGILNPFYYLYTVFDTQKLISLSGFESYYFLKYQSSLFILFLFLLLIILSSTIPVYAVQYQQLGNYIYYFDIASVSISSLPNNSYYLILLFGIGTFNY
jgi:hypothetical protein